MKFVKNYQGVIAEDRVAWGSLASSMILPLSLVILARTRATECD